jgi:uncharacterized damage-inducible protein DinB
MARRPAPSDYPPYFDTYVRLVEDADVAELMARQIDDTMAWYRGLSEAQAASRYAADKWSIKEVLGHLADAERVFQYRALGAARGDRTSFPSFEQDDYVKTANAHQRTWASLLEDFKAVRQSSITLFRPLDDAALDRIGTVNQRAMTARALGYIILGHERHHLAILKDRYLKA